jgi:1-acyl-sn-glycerol-3-phosphate acyltransferase
MFPLRGKIALLAAIKRQPLPAHGMRRLLWPQRLSMQNIIIEKPYQFIPPFRATYWSTAIKALKVPARYLSRYSGVTKIECRHVERLRKSIDAGHGILLTPNHPRTSDPLAMGTLAADANCHFFAMASWHLFHQSRLHAWAIHKMGAFSVHREGVDRQAINTAIELLAGAKRPLVIFPEGATSRTNDHLHALLDGVAFIARTAAKKRAKLSPPGKVVVHPIGIKYVYQGDIHKTADDILTEIEHRLTWPPQRELPLLLRMRKVGAALLTLKEIEYLNDIQPGKLRERLRNLMDGLLGPLEQEWFGKVQEGPVVPRVKGLRMRLLPEMITGNLTKEQRQHRWKQLAQIYLAQQLSCYPPDYLVERPTVDRVLETLERFEEDLTDKARVNGPMHAVIEVDEPIEVSPERDRKATVDPLMEQIKDRLEAMISRLGQMSPVIS